MKKKNELNPSHYGLSSKSGVKGIAIDPTSETVNQILHQLLYNKSRREIMILPFKLVHSFSLAQIKWVISEKMKFVHQWLSICLILIIDFLSWALTFPFFLFGLLTDPCALLLSRDSLDAFTVRHSFCSATMYSF